MKCEVEKFMVKRIQWLWSISLFVVVNKLRKAKIKIEILPQRIQIR